ncbi:MAG: biopolymer transporter ExbD [Prevotella sp.]|jgi:biopolymer transport protein ExbD|nr:biopolymer transporter ExbD [Prevotella sp.]
MRSMFHGRRRHSVPTLNVASMPDLIFTVLFFFMIVTHMRSDEVKVRLEVPAGSEVKKLAGHPAIVNIYIGRQGDKETGRQDNTWLVQLNGDIVSPSEIPARINAIRSKLSPENAERLTVSFRADRHAPMGLVSDVKRALQKAYALKINYSATEISTINH